MTTPAPDAEPTARIESDSPRAARSRGAEAQFAPGTIVAGRYRIASILGSGGMGEVYRADDTRLGQPVALKFLPQRLARDPMLRERLYDEVRLGRQIAHPNVCRIYDIVDWEDSHFVSMEYVDGEDLSRLLKRIGRLAPDKAVEIARGIAAGLAAAHAKGILHRDLKPANIMIDSHGTPRIMDFGLALAAEDDSQQGVIAGTPAYMALEQLAGAPATIQTDLYSLGLVMYELVTGKRAHNARTLPERVRDSGSEITTPSSLIRDVEPAVERIILRCLSNDPAQRPRSAREVIEALPGGDPLAMALAAGETPSPRLVAAAPVAGSLSRTSAWTLLGSILVVVAALLTLMVLARPLQRFGLTKPPEAQRERARELLRGLGIPAQTYTSHGFNYNLLYYDWIVNHDRSPRRWERLGRGYPIATYWLREQQTPLIDDDVGRSPQPTIDRPPMTEAGAAAIELDSRGALFSLRAVPAPSWPARRPDWNALLAAAGLHADALQAAEPRQLPQSYADARAAWTGRDANGAPIRVEAAMLRGVPVLFRVTGPWDAGDVGAREFGRRFGLVLFTLGTLALGTGVLLAWRNLRRRRGDRQGALRVGTTVFLLVCGALLLVADHELAPLHEMKVVEKAVSSALYSAAIFFLVYLALEPYLRRRWPDRLVSWARLLEGNWRDPMIGRDIMIGLLCGTMQTFAIHASDIAKELSYFGGFRPVTGDQEQLALATPLDGLARVLDAATFGVRSALAVMIVLMVLTVVLRKRSLAIGAFFLLNTGVLFAGAGHLGALPLIVALAAMISFATARFGLLTAAALQFAFAATFFHPLPDAFAWYTLRASIPLASMLALAIWAFRTSLGDQRAFNIALD